MTDCCTVYLIDDDASVRRGLSRLLTASGYRVITCETAEALIALTPLERPSCLLVDIRMPGTTGLDLLRALHDDLDPPVIMVSGHADEATAARAIAAGAIAVLAKPVDQDSLVSAVEVGLERDRRMVAGVASQASPRHQPRATSIDPLPGNARYHAVLFYADALHLSSAIGDFLADGLAAGQPLLLIVTPLHWGLIRHDLLLREFDVDRLVAARRVVVLDAQQTLDQFLIGNCLDADRFRSIVGGTLRGIGDADECIRAYGEMVNLLCESGRFEHAVSLELLWNALADTHTFSLMCGYAVDSVGEEAQETLKALHSHPRQPLQIDA
jgi:DNA-binding response OmpR family regulator